MTLSKLLISLCLFSLTTLSFLSLGYYGHYFALAQMSDQNFETYNNPAFGIRIQYPPDWGRLDLSFLGNDSADIDFYPLEEVSQAIAVKVQAKSLPLQNMTLDDYTKTQINYTEEQLLESNASTLAGLPAHKVIFTNLGLKTMQIWTIEGNRVYTITYVAEEEDFQKDLQIAERMIKSFQITK